MVTCVTVMNGAMPNFSFDQYRKSSALASRATGKCRRWSGSPGSSALSSGIPARIPSNSSRDRIGVGSIVLYCAMQSAPNT